MRKRSYLPILLNRPRSKCLSITLQHNICSPQKSIQEYNSPWFQVVYSTSWAAIRSLTVNWLATQPIKPDSADEVARIHLLLELEFGCPRDECQEQELEASLMPVAIVKRKSHVTCEKSFEEECKFVFFFDKRYINVCKDKRPKWSLIKIPLLVVSRYSSFQMTWPSESCQAHDLETKIKIQNDSR